MEDVLHNIFKISLMISLAYILGLAARIWWELKLALLFIFGFVFFGTFLQSLIFGQGLAIAQDIEDLIIYTLMFTPLGYLTGLPIIKYFNVRLESVFASDEFDPTYRKFAKRHRQGASPEDLDEFYGNFRTHHTETRAEKRAGPNTSYEQYSQYRRSQSRTENTAPPPPQDYRSDKDKMFDILEVSNRQASPKDIKSAYRKLAWKYHPDVLAKTELSDKELEAAETRMQEINHAYDWLKDNGFAE